MDPVSRFFLHAKHWQIFLLIIGGYVAGWDAFTLSSLPPAAWLAGPPIATFLAWIVILLGILCYLAWLWSTGEFLNLVDRSASRIQLGFFRIALIYIGTYFVALIVHFRNSKPELPPAVFPLHLLAMFCVFYVQYFVSRRLRLAENAKPAPFGDYFGRPLLMCFFLFVVWFIQPRINQIYQEWAGTPKRDDVIARSSG